METYRGHMTWPHWLKNRSCRGAVGTRARRGACRPARAQGSLRARRRALARTTASLVLTPPTDDELERLLDAIDAHILESALIAVIWPDEVDPR